MKIRCGAAPTIGDGSVVVIGDRVAQRVHALYGRGTGIRGVVVESDRLLCGCGCWRRELVVADEADGVRYTVASDARRIEA